MKKIAICSAALLALTLGGTVQAQEGERNAERSERAERPAKNGKGSELRTIMRSSMKMMREEMKRQREAGREGKESHRKSLEGKSVSEMVAAIKKHRLEQFEKGKKHFEDAFAMAKANFELEMAKLDNVDEAQKERALAHFDKMQEKHRKRGPEMMRRQMAFLDKLAADPEMTPEKLHKAIKEKRRELKQQMDKRRGEGTKKRRHKGEGRGEGRGEQRGGEGREHGPNHN